jgi:N utilization substance protein B
MTDRTSRPSVPKGKRTGPKQSPNSAQGQKATPSRRARSIQQARVLAMQVLFEDDLTDHTLEEILQHLGEQQRSELTEAYAHVRSRANGIIETIDFLARNADPDATEAVIARFEDASTRALASLSEPEDAEEGERADYVPPVQLRAEEITLPVLRRYRDAVAGEVRTGKHIAEPEGDEARLAAEFAARLAALRGEDVADDAHLEDTELDHLAQLRHEAAHTVSSALANHERASRATMMEMVQRTASLVHGAVANRATIDAAIERAAPAYPIGQIASIDRSVLRVAVYELYHDRDVPGRVAVNEAVEIAKRYGGPNSGKFVNGVLRTISKGLAEGNSGATTRG